MPAILTQRLGTALLTSKFLKTVRIIADDDATLHRLASDPASDAGAGTVSDHFWQRWWAAARRVCAMVLLLIRRGPDRPAPP